MVGANNGVSASLQQLLGHAGNKLPPLLVAFLLRSLLLSSSSILSLFSASSILLLLRFFLFYLTRNLRLSLVFLGDIPENDAAFGFWLASHMPLRPDLKQDLLETRDSHARMRRLQAQLALLVGTEAPQDCRVQ